MSTTRRAFLGGAIGAGITSVIGVPALPAPSTSGVFCLADLQRAVAMLSANNIPAPPWIVLHPKVAADLEIAKRRWAEDEALAKWQRGATYRARLTAGSLMAHERHREALGKRGHVTADEVVARVQAMEAA